MPHKLFRLGALLTALTLALTACAPGASSSGSAASSSESIPVDASSMVMQDAVPTIEPEPEPEPMPVLTQEDIDAALVQVMENYSAAGVTVATVERGLVSQAGAWGWAVKNEREMTPDTKIRIASISKVVKIGRASCRERV